MAIQLRGLHAQLRPAAEFALEIARFNGISPVITSVTRDFAKQAQLRANFERCVAQGRFPSPPDCKYPANRPGDSAHNWGLAFDSWVPEADIDVWTAIRRYVGFRVPDTGIPGKRGDWIHAELPQWRSYVTIPPRLK